MVTLTLRQRFSIPLEVVGVLPERLIPLDKSAVALLPVLCGNRTQELGQFFDITHTPPSGASAEPVLRFEGDLSNVHRIGEGMGAGRIECAGTVGRHAGAKMTGGVLHLREDAGDWAGAEMRGGRIIVEGSVGACAGAGYRGARQGMSGGSILIRGNAGHELGLLMRRGMIVVEGICGEFAGASMIAGSIVLLGEVGGKLAAGMKRGTIITRYGRPSSGFRESCVYEPTVLPLIVRSLRQLGSSRVEDLPRNVRCFRGDVLTGGRGEMWTAA